MSRLFRRLILVGSCVAMAAALPTTLLSDAGASQCETNCYNRYAYCMSQGLPGSFCLQQFNTCIDFCQQVVDP